MQKRTSHTFFKRIFSTLLVAIGIVFVINLILTIPQTIEKSNLENRINQNVKSLKEVGYEINLEIITSYKFNKKTADQELSILKSVDDSINTIIQNETESLKSQNILLAKDYEDLKLQVADLEISNEFNLKLIEDPQDLLNNFSNNKAYIEVVQNIKKSINDFKEEKQSKGQFVNPLWGLTKREITNLVSETSLEDKISQLFMWNINGSILTSGEKTQFEKTPPGGIILMGYNISNQSQLATLTKAIQKTNTKIPVFISTDQEGGVVKRVSWDSTAGQKQWASMTNDQMCSLGKTRSNLLLSSGINVNFSPVVDLSYSGSGFINNRTISEDKAVVSEKANQYISCSQESGIITTLKHFPGHGSTAEDSHYYLPIINKSKEDWLSSDAIPFINNLNSKFLMVGHLKLSKIDNDNPATTSKIILTDILRDELKYEGIVITDDMNQLHRSTGISLKDATIKSLNAGVDIILYVGLPTSPEKLIEIVKTAIENGEISKELIDEKVYRILVTKQGIK